MSACYAPGSVAGNRRWWLACDDGPLVILFNLSGHGHFDLSAYDSYFSGTMDPNA